MIRNWALDETGAQVRDSVSRRLDQIVQASPKIQSVGLDAWSALAELGVLSAPMPEHEGGLGGGIADSLAVLEPLGRHALNVPLLDGVCVPLVLANHVGNSTELRQLLSQAVSGGPPVALAWTEAGYRWSRTPTVTRAHTVEGGWELNGHKSAVRWASEASAFVVSARAETETGLFLVPSKSLGLELEHYPTADMGHAAELKFNRLRLPESARLDAGEGFAALNAALDAGAALVLAESVGAMDRCVEMTVEYLKAREQFGTPLSKLQALQHRLVDIYTLCETSWSLTLDAIAALNSKTPEPERVLRVSSAKAYVGFAGRRVGQEALQLHGAIGMTMEYPLGRYLTRLTLIDLGYGDSNWHLERVAYRLGCDDDAA